MEVVRSTVLLKQRDQRDGDNYERWSQDQIAEIEFFSPLSNVIVAQQRFISEQLPCASFVMLLAKSNICYYS